MVKKIAEAGEVEIYADKKSSYSFFASPYQAHRDYAAVDICQNKKFGDHALSPVYGTVIKTIKFASPTITKKSLPEYLILIKSGGDIARIMHLSPKVKAGDRVAVGDEIGEFIKNGFFTYWVDPIIHIEVRKPDNLLRARGGLELKPLLSKVKNKPTKKLVGVVRKATPRNTVVELRSKAVAKVDGEPAELDGATNIDYSAVFGRFREGETVQLNNVDIGVIVSRGTYASIFKTAPLYISVNNIPFEGIQFIPSTKEIKLLPKKYGETPFKKGDKVEIKIENAGT